MKSASRSGPIGWLVPSRMPLSMSSAEPTPWRCTHTSAQRAATQLEAGGSVRVSACAKVSPHARAPNALCCAHGPNSSTPRRRTLAARSGAAQACAAEAGSACAHTRSHKVCKMHTMAQPRITACQPCTQRHWCSHLHEAEEGFVDHWDQNAVHQEALRTKKCNTVDERAHVGSGAAVHKAHCAGAPGRTKPCCSCCPSQLSVLALLLLQSRNGRRARAPLLLCPAADCSRVREPAQPCCRQPLSASSPAGPGWWPRPCPETLQVPCTPQTSAGWCAGPLRARPASSAAPGS